MTDINLYRERKMVFKGTISETTKAYCFYLLKSKGSSLRTIAKECGISPASVLRIKKTFDSEKQGTKPTKGTNKTGRKERLSCRQKRKLIRRLKSLRREGGNFSASRLMEEAGISIQEASLRTITRFLNKEGYFSLQARKKLRLIKRARFEEASDLREESERKVS